MSLDQGDDTRGRQFDRWAARGNKFLSIACGHDWLVVDKPTFNSECVQDTPDGRRVAFQVWDWASDARSYRISQFLIKQNNGAYEVQHFESELRALLRDEIMTAVQGAGYEDVCWHDPEANGYYQPVVTARNR